MGITLFDPVTLSFEFYLYFEDFNLDNIFWIVRARIFIFHMYIPCDKIFLLVFNLLILTIDLYLFKKKHIGHNFLIMNIRVFINAHAHFLWQDLATAIKIFVLVTLAVFGLGNYWGHLCFTNTSCFVPMSATLYRCKCFLYHVIPDARSTNRASRTTHIFPHFGIWFLSPI